MPNFKDMQLMPEIQRALDELGFDTPTEIQSKAIPILLSSEKIDFHGQAQTGTGKTLAFSIPLLQRVDPKSVTPQALIVVPTRELAVQVNESIAKISKHISVKTALIYGGVSIENQISTLKKGVQIVVGTPGRIRDLIARKALKLDNIKVLVLDEADIMLDMGFKEEIDEILKFIPKSRAIWLFSATVKSGIDEIKRNHMEDPIVIRVSTKQLTSKGTEQLYCVVPYKSRVHAIIRFIQSAMDFYGIVFCQTKILASETADELSKRGYSVGALHGDMSQEHRNLVIKKFKQKDLSILIATDVAARGIDVAGLTHVINFSIPEDLESYVHRVGRTGRAGKMGTAITFINKSEVRIIKRMEQKFGVTIKPVDVPSKETLINIAVKEAENYLSDLKSLDKIGADALNKLVQNLAAENVRLALINLMYDKFIAKLDLEEIPFTHVEQEPDQLQEIYLNVGQDDGVTEEDVREFVLASGKVNENEINKIRVIKRRSFVKLNSDCSPDLLFALRGKLLNGRKVRVDMTCVIGESGPRDGFRREGSRRGDRGGSGRGGRGGRGGGRSENRSRFSRQSYK